jgi:hypothetical protein
VGESSVPLCVSQCEHYSEGREAVNENLMQGLCLNLCVGTFVTGRLSRNVSLSVFVMLLHVCL